MHTLNSAAPNHSQQPIFEPISWLRMWLIRVLGLLLLGTLSFSIPPILLTLGSYVYFQTSNLILPGVYAGDLDLGGLTLNEAEQLIETEWNLKDDITVFDLDDPSRNWLGQASSFGLSVDAASTALIAHQQGREGMKLELIKNMLVTLRSGAYVEYVVSIDAVMAKSQIESWADRVSLPSCDDSIALDGRKLIVEEARAGKAVDVLASLEMLIDDPKTILLEHQMIPLVMVPIPAQRFATQEAIDALEKMLERDASLRAYDPVLDEYLFWSPSDAEFDNWIDIHSEDGHFQAVLLQDRIRAYIEGINVTLGGQRAIDVDLAIVATVKGLSGEQVDPLIVRYRPGSYVVQPGDNLVSISFEIGMPYWKLNDANPELASRGLVVGEELIVPPRDDMLSLPIIPDKRIVISILQQRMWVYEDSELMHEYVISTGIPSSPTLPGIFQINSHYENAYASIWDLSMPHFMGIYDAVPGLTNGIHGLPLLASGRRLWADILGNPASFGCIILDLQAAEQLFYWADDGVVVEIQG